MKNLRSLVAIFIVGLMAITAIPAAAQQQTDEQRQEWLKELRDYKHKFLVKELSLTRDQENAFFRIYDKMDEEMMRVNDETRAMERKALRDDNATDTELESTARALFDQKRKESEIELRYFDELKNVLNKRQLVRLKDVERRFNSALLKYHKQRRPAAPRAAK